MNINIDTVNKILSKNSQLNCEFVPYGKVYLSTTENIKGIMSKIDLQGKSVLSVAGSGDQALNAYFNGAKEVTLFDINPLAMAQSELKITAAKKLTYEEFCEFFIPGLGNVLCPLTFSKLSNYLREDVANYYDYLFSNYKPSEIFVKTAYRFLPSIDKLESLNSYMKKDNFKKLPKILEDKEIKYLESSLLDLPTKLEDKYDAILLSNISDSLEDIWNINTLKSYKRFIHILSDNLNKNGTIQCGYIYPSYNQQRRKPLFANTTERQKIFNDKEFREWKVETYVPNSGLDDTIIIYEKKKRKVA